jgi:hypothetical protein
MILKFIRLAIVFSLISTSWCFANPSERLEQIKMARRFGVGVSAGGALAVFGVEADVNITENFSVSVGLGSGIDYSTAMAKARWYLLGEWVSPYVGVGVSRWWTDGTAERNIGPSVLVNRFLSGVTDYSNGFNVWILSPSIGVQFMHPKGFAVSAELQYLFRLFDFSNGTYAGMGIHWYF